MKSQILSIAQLLEIKSNPAERKKRMVSTAAFDWLYVSLSLLLTIGLMMDIWSHSEFGPDQSLFNEYHLLFYGSMTAIIVMLSGFVLANLKQGVPFKSALPQGYGIGLFGALLFGAAGTVDLIGHAILGFESGIEALVSPTHLFLFISWFLILFAPIRAARARTEATNTRLSFRSMLPQSLSYGAMFCCITMPLMNLFPMGLSPHMLNQLRPADDTYGVLLGVAGTILQTAIVVAMVLWLAREFHLPKGAYTIILTFYGLFLTLLTAELNPWALFGLLGISLDIFYAVVKPDATRRFRFLLFAFFTSAMMWIICYAGLILTFGMQNIYYSAYNLFGSVAQGIVMGLLVGYLMSMPTARAIIAHSEEKSHA